MNAFLERINRSADEITEQNVIMDISEQKIIRVISEDETYVFTFTSACPTSFLTCC